MLKVVFMEDLMSECRVVGEEDIGILFFRVNKGEVESVGEGERLLVK